MTASATPPVAPIVLAGPGDALRITLDPVTGAPCRIDAGPVVTGAEPDPAQVAVAATLVTGGTEARGRMGGLEYRDTRDVTLTGGALAVRPADAGPGARAWSVDVATTEPERWRAAWHVTIHDGADARPRIALALEVIAVADAAILRDVRVAIDVRTGAPDDWRVQSPGNPIRSDLPLADLERPVEVAPAAQVAGSTGLVALERTTRPRTILVWPICADAMGRSVLHPVPGGVRLDWTTEIAGRPDAGGSLRVETLHLDVAERPWRDVLAAIPDALAALGIATPGDPPAWGVATSLYEVQVGFGVFADGYRYAPYPTAADLLADLPRIADLGFDGIQIMPRQPYPSYNVHDYADVTTSYGDEADIRRIVEACHARGMRVILDILMHGVIDNEILDETIAGIHAGPYGKRLGETIPDITSLDTTDPVEQDLYPIAWCAHVVNFGPFWRAGSPPRHPLADAHPEWFCRDSAGHIIGVYTKAFDLAHPGWQRWFIDAALDLVRRLDIDGFRFDAPSYNQFHNWSERTRRNAAVSMLGCLSLFERLRPELRALRPDALLYTEPSGILYRRTMDLTYNYDEQWLIRSVLTSGAGRRHWVRNGHELARWFADRDAALPRGSITAHHLDSHDSFWWAHPGQKWRREQFGIPATAALMTMFTLSGGPYMTFVGGEVGIEDAVRRVHAIRADHPAFARGVSDPEAIDAGDDRVYAVVRRLGDAAGVLLVNLSDVALDLRVTLAPGTLPDAPGSLATDDLLGGTAITWEPAAGRHREAAVRLAAWGAIALVPAPGDANAPVSRP